MKIATHSALFGRFQLEKAFEIASNIGYDGIELWGARPHAYVYDMDGEEIEKVLWLKEHYRLEIPIYAPEILGYPYNLASRHREEREETVLYLKAALGVAVRLGVPKVEVTVGHSGYGRDYKKVMEVVVGALSEVVEHAEKLGEDVVLEPLTMMESNIFRTADDVCELFEKIKSPHLKAMMDTVPPVVHWEPYAEYFEKWGDKLCYIHFVDSNGYDQSHLPLGSGILNMEEILRTILRFGYDGWLCVELLSAGMHEPEMYAAREQRMLRELLDKLGV